jgi:hypothetical protein
MLEVQKGNTIPLEDLHTLEHYDLLVREKDQSTEWHKKYYEKYKKDFLPLYLELVKDLKERFGYEQIIYQVIPTFRVQLANGNLAVILFQLINQTQQFNFGAQILVCFAHKFDHVNFVGH